MREPLGTKAGGGYRQVEEPGEQNAGETQVVTFETLQEASVCWMVCPEQV